MSEIVGHFRDRCEVSCHWSSLVVEAVQHCFLNGFSRAAPARRRPQATALASISCLIYEAEAGTNPSGVVGTTLLVARDGAVPKLRPSFGLRGADRVASAGEERQYRCKLRANAIAVATIMASGTIRSPPPGIRASDSIGRSISPTSLSWTELNASAGRRLGKSQELEQFPVKWAHMQDNFGNAPEQWSARQDGAARLEQALGAYREAPYGDCCDSSLHGREPRPEHDAMPKTTNYGSCSFPRSDQCKAYGVYARLGIVNAHSRRSSDPPSRATERKTIARRVIGQAGEAPCSLSEDSDRVGQAHSQVAGPCRRRRP